MSEKASVFQTVQVGVETTPGTAVAADIKLLATSVIPGIRMETDVFRAEGNKYASFATTKKEWSEARIDGRVTYNEILYLLSSLLSEPTPAQQGTTSAYLWTFISNISAEDASKTLTVEQGDANTAWRTSGLRVSGLEFTFTRNEATLSGSAYGKPLETGITLTSNPSSMTPRPVLPNQLTLYLSDTQSGLSSATALTRGFSLGWSLTDKSALAWPVGQDPVAVETVPALKGSLKLATDTVGLGLIDTMRNGSTKWVRVKATGPVIEDTYHYTFQIDFPAQVEDVGDFSDEDGLYLVEYTLSGIHDSTWGKPFEITVMTDVDSL